MRALAAAEGSWVVMHYSEPDADRARADAQVLMALGLKVQEAPLEVERDQLALRMPQGREATSVALFYLSRYCIEHVSAVECERRVQAIRGAGQRMIAIHLDPVLPQGQIAALFAHVATLNSYSLGQRRHRLRLTKQVLEQIDAQGEPTIAVFDADDAKTSMLPRSLLIEYAQKRYVIPASFLGLVTVGRGASCQISLDSTFVSRLHGCFRVSDEHFCYRDMSSNGTTLFFGHEEELLHDAESVLPAAGSLRVGDVDLAFAIAG